MSIRDLSTLVRLIMTGYIVAGKNNDGYKYGGITEKPPNLNELRYLPLTLKYFHRGVNSETTRNFLKSHK